MERFISKYDEKDYTYMLKLINSIGGRNLKYNWLITDIEAYPNDNNIFYKLENEYVILSNDELLDILEKEDFQWIWAVFSAIPSNIDEKDILQYQLPNRYNISPGYNSEASIQHPLADIEIDCADSSYFIINFKDKSIKNIFLKCYPKAFKDINSPEDYFSTWDSRTENPTFEFSYHSFNNGFSLKNRLNAVFKKNDNVVHHTDSIYIYQKYFDDFINKYRYFDNTTLKNGEKGTFSYFGMDNYYNQEQTKIILEKLKKEISDHNKLIIRFLEKAIKEHDGFYIHGI